MVKLPIWQLRPQVFSDSPGYLVPAVSLLAGRGYGVQENGFRSPTYPLFLALILAPFDRTNLSACRDAHRPVCIDQAAKSQDGALGLRAIVAAQVILGLLTSALLFGLGWRITRSLAVALLMGAGYALNLATAFWEISLLTETLTTFLLVLAIYMALSAGELRLFSRITLGVVLGALALCHMLFLAFWPIPAAFLFVRTKRLGAGIGMALRKTAPVLLIPVCFILAWSGYNYIVNGVFSPSIITGYVTSQMVAPVLENAPQGYDDITELYVGYRNALIAETGSYSGAIFRAWPAMMNASGMKFAELSQKLTGLSLYLMVAYPSSYLSVAAQAWQKFWDVSLYHYGPIPAGGPTLMLWFVDQDFQRYLSALFWLSPAGLAILMLVRRGSSYMAGVAVPVAPILLMMATVWFAAAVVTFTSFGDNSRYRSHVLPLQYASIVLLGWAGWQTVWHVARRRFSELETR